MIRVGVGTIFHLKDLLGSRRIEMDLPAESTVADVLEAMADLMGPAAVPALLRPEDRGLQPHIRVMVNGRDIAFLGGLATSLVDGDEVLVLPPAGGG